MPNQRRVEVLVDKLWIRATNYVLNDDETLQWSRKDGSSGTAKKGEWRYAN